MRRRAATFPELFRRSFATTLGRGSAYLVLTLVASMAVAGLRALLG